MHEKGKHHQENISNLHVAKEKMSAEQRLFLKRFYSQPTTSQTTDRILTTADEVISQGRQSLKIKRNGETITYDSRGRAVVIEDGTMTLKRTFDDSGYITEEELRGIDAGGNTVVETSKFSYGFQHGKLAVQAIHVTPLRLTKYGVRVPIEEEFVIGFQDLSPVIPLKSSKPSFTSNGGKHQ
jgi:hypothetical protein